MGLFNKNEDRNTTPANSNNMLMIRMLAVGYLLYTVYNMIQLYIKGGEDAPSLGLLIAAVALFVIGSAWIVIISVKQWKRMKRDQQAAYEEEERLKAEAELAESEDYTDEFDDVEDPEEKED